MPLGTEVKIHFPDWPGKDRRLGKRHIYIKETAENNKAERRVAQW
jgi:hypothetical protein